MSFRKSLDYYLLQHWRAARLELATARLVPRISAITSSRTGVRGRLQPMTVFTAADAKYLAKYGAAFVGSLVKYVFAPRLHVHLYNPTPSSIALLQSFGSAYPTLSLTWTTENFSARLMEQRSGSGPKQSWKSLYICCSRFLAARSVHNALGTALLIVDIDLIFNGAIANRFGAGIDYAVMRRPHEHNLCKRTLGGVVYAAFTPLGRMFLRETQERIERFLAAGRYWFAFDQYALHLALRHMAKEEHLKGFSEITKEDVSFDLAPEALILYPKGMTKDTREFARLAHRFEREMDMKLAKAKVSASQQLVGAR